MRALKIALALVLVAAGSMAAAAASKPKAAPGKCGTGMYYSMKDKKCMAK